MTFEFKRFGRCDGCGCAPIPRRATPTTSRRCTRWPTRCWRGSRPRWTPTSTPAWRWRRFTGWWARSTRAWRGSAPAPSAWPRSASALEAFERMDAVFGFLALTQAEREVDVDFAGWVEERIAARQAARAAKDFATSDAIRAELAARGVTVEDTAQGPRWSVGA